MDKKALNSIMMSEDISNIVSVIFVLICFLGMILFIASFWNVGEVWRMCEFRGLPARFWNYTGNGNIIVLRVHGDELVFHGPMHQVTPRIPQMNMMKVHIPFTFKLLETSKSTYSEIQYSVSSQIKYNIHVFWGVNIKELHVFLWRPWSALREMALNDTMLRGHYQQPGPSLQKSLHSDETIKLSLPAPLDLGTPPRLCYPLVIFLMRIESEGELHPDETVALINVVHIKDSVCTLPTSILAQYLKQANGQLSCLKQLYLATGNPAGYEDDGHIPLTLAEPVVGDSDTTGVWNMRGEQLCVVCQYFPLSRALLPCRHTCICASCFDKLERCPMCRGPIKSYFCIRSEEYMPLQSSKASPQHGPFYNWLDNINERIIDFLGFQR